MIELLDRGPRRDHRNGSPVEMHEEKDATVRRRG